MSSIFTISATKPYTATVIPIATTIRIAARAQMLSAATSLRAITMISALRMKSVRIAPDVTFFSASGPRSVAGSSGAWSFLEKCS